MKRRSVFLLAPLFMLFSFLAVVAQSSDYTPSKNEKLYGAWLNESNFPAKMVKSLNYGGDYYPGTASAPFRTYKEIIVKKWDDADGNIFYDTITTFLSSSIKGTIVRSIYKIPKDGQTMEMTWSEGGSFPTEINKDHNYFYFTRSSSH